jgi:hypothetical protein
LPHSVSNFGLGVGYAAAHFRRNNHVRRESRDFAAATGDCDIGADHKHSRPLDDAAVDGITQGHVGEGAIAAKVSNRGESGTQCSARVLDAFQNIFGA